MRKVEPVVLLVALLKLKGLPLSDNVLLVLVEIPYKLYLENVG